MLNINYYISYMRRELFGGAIFVSIVIGMNYILKNFLCEYSDENEKVTLVEQKQNDIVMEQKQNDIVMEQKQHDIVMEKIPDNLLDDLLDNLLDDLPGELPDDDLHDDLDEGAITINLLNSVIPMVDVLETKLKDDIILIQQILDKKQHLIDLNARLSEIKEKLQDLRNDLVR